MVGTPSSLAIWEPGDDPAVVLLPGIFGGTSVWEPTMRRLSGERRVCALDLPRLVKADAGRVTVLDAAVALTRWLEDAPAKRPVLVGHSQGGTVALVVAATCPELVGGLVLVDAPALPLGRGIARSLADILRSTREQSNSSFPSMLADAWRLRPHTLWRACRDIMRTDASSYLADLECPVLVVWGELDRIVPLAMAHRIAEVLPTAELHVLPGLGHAPMEEAPERFVALLNGYLASLGAPVEQPAAGLAPAPLRVDTGI